MRLAAFNPRLTWSSETGLHELSFTCPKCGAPYIISVHVRIDAPAKDGIWVITLPKEPSGDGWNGVTVLPSIANANHGRKKTCGYHCTISDGNILP